MNFEEIANKEIIDENGCSLGTVEDYLRKFMGDNSFKMVKSDESIQNLLIKLAETPDLLSKKELTRLAKFMNKPINSYENFYMTNQNYGYIHLGLKNSELRLFILLADLLTSGTEVKSYKNNKPIKSIDDIVEVLGISDRTFSRSRKGLEEKRLVKFQKIGDKTAILFNPIYVKKGKISELTFQEFKSEIANENYLWYLFLRKELLETSDLILIK